VERRKPRLRGLQRPSASPAFLRQSAASLAGRILWYTLPGLSLDEVGADAADSLWRRGGFPRAFLAASDEASFRWRCGFL
jgi:predicted AAA+ superfamily ATPase